MVESSQTRVVRLNASDAPVSFSTPDGLPLEAYLAILVITIEGDNSPLCSLVVDTCYGAGQPYKLMRPECVIGLFGYERMRRADQQVQAFAEMGGMTLLPAAAISFMN